MLLLGLHHIIADGWSMGVLVRELAAALPRPSRTAARPCRRLPIQYADYAVWQRQWLHGAELGAQLAYWRQQLAGAARWSACPPIARGQPCRASAARLAHAVTLPAALTAGAARAGATRAGDACSWCCWRPSQVLLARYSGDEDDLCVGTPIAGRNRAELEGLIGFFVNTLVLRTDLSGNPTLPRAAGAGARDGAGGLRPPGSALRAAGGGTAAGAGPRRTARCSR